MYTHSVIKSNSSTYKKITVYKEQITLYMGTAYKIAVGTNMCLNHIIKKLLKDKKNQI